MKNNEIKYLRKVMSEKNLVNFERKSEPVTEKKTEKISEPIIEKKTEKKPDPVEKKVQPLCLTTNLYITK
jgi:hypothetical protein